MYLKLKHELGPNLVNELLCESVEMEIKAEPETMASDKKEVMIHNFGSMLSHFSKQYFGTAQQTAKKRPHLHRRASAGQYHI